MEIIKKNNNKINGKVLFAIKCDNKMELFINEIPSYKNKIKFIREYYGISINRVIDIEKYQINNRDNLCILVYQEKMSTKQKKIEIIRTKENEIINFELLGFDSTKINVEKYISYLI